VTPGRRPTDGGQPLAHSPFDALAGSAFPAGASVPAAPTKSGSPTPVPPKNRGRVDILRSTAGRGGKTVTLVQGFVGIGGDEKERLAKQMQKRCGCGGTVKDGRIEIQGDQREAVAEVLVAAGFRPVFAGG
jgi:translation initiation factor 1